MRVLLTLLFALFVGLVWLVYGTDIGPFDWGLRSAMGAVIGVAFMAALIVIAFRAEDRRS